ncbi:PrsW family glutamic-type intramembrane protease [Paenibacillus caui]|uniref:PrsW family glutamic-type intramembrane protease n=1 Tax=Paenibacillus caui TaxID=2873927 RepID=UPI001CA96664|nr:PrsW family glutamic-type intramembrane protease [Paenibacillus caui]
MPNDFIDRTCFIYVLKGGTNLTESLYKLRNGIQTFLETTVQTIGSWIRRHPVVYQLYAVISWILLAVFVISLFYLKDSRTLFHQFMWSFYVLLQFWFLGRSKTLTWRSYTSFFLVGAWFITPLNALIVQSITEAFAGETRDAWSQAFLTPIVEESLKLLPLVFFLLFSRKATSLSLSDFALIGGATGAGFQFLEETARRLTTGMFPYGSTLLGGRVIHWNLFDWFPGYFEESIAPDKMTAGHPLLTALVSLGIGFAVRYRKRLTRAAYLFPLLLLLWAIFDHAAWNGMQSIPKWLERIHDWLGSGYRAKPLFLLLLGLALLLDYAALNRIRKELPRLRYEPFINPVSELLAITVMLLKDRRQFGYLLQFLRERRELGMTLQFGNSEARSRLPDLAVQSIYAALTIAAALLLCVLSWTAFGSFTPGGEANTCFACLFDSLQNWWDRLSGLEKGALIAGAFALSFPFLGVWSAIGLVSAGFGFAASGHQIADIIRNPRRLMSPEYAAAAVFTLGLSRIPFGKIVASRLLPTAKGLVRYEIRTAGGLTYRTMLGSRGEIRSVFAKLEPHHLGTGTETNSASRIFARLLGRGTDDAGHAIGNKLGGLGTKTSGNLFPQNPTINRGIYREFERRIAEEVAAGKNVFVRVVPKYDGGSTRPYEVLYQVRIDGETITRVFPNP